MNVHKKILSIGFKKTGYHERTYKDDGSYRYTMIPKDGIEERKYDRSKRSYISTIRKAPKWTYFYLLEYTEDTKIWAKVEKHTDVTIYLEGPKTKTGVDLIYSMPSYSNEFNKLNSEMDIIKLLPKEMQRDFILKSLFG